VKAASQFAIARHINVSSAGAEMKKDKSFRVERKHFERALRVTVPALGIAEDRLKAFRPNELINYGRKYLKLIDEGHRLTSRLKVSKKMSVFSLLLEGAQAAGITSIAAKLALDSKCPFTKFIGPEDFVAFSEQAKCEKLVKIFDDAHKSPLSFLVLDNLEVLLEYVTMNNASLPGGGPVITRFSNPVLQCLVTLLKKPIREGRRLFVLSTTNSLALIRDLRLQSLFNTVLHVPLLDEPAQIKTVLEAAGIKLDEQQFSEFCAIVLQMPIGIKQLLTLIDISMQDNVLTMERVMECYDESVKRLR